jgi:hypothetical protein
MIITVKLDIRHNYARILIFLFNPFLDRMSVISWIALTIASITGYLEKHNNRLH